MMSNFQFSPISSNVLRSQDNMNGIQSGSLNGMYSNGKYLQNSFEKPKIITNNNNNNTNTLMNNTSNNINNNDNNFKVVIRIRPFLSREIDSGKLIPTLQTANDHKMIQAIEYYNYDSLPDGISMQDVLQNTNKYTIHSFTFDHVFSQDATQVEVYEYTAKPAVQSMLKGYNATILAYGQTGTGKTHTMEGFRFSSQDPQRGIIPRCMEEIFRYIENISNAKTTFMVRASYLQIYNEIISDLLRTDKSGLLIREDKKKGLYVEGLSEWVVRSPSEIYSLIQKGATSRVTASTKMNDVSSRSHAVFVITVEKMTGIEEGGNIDGEREIRVGKLNLVDLAGSERVRVTGATGQRLEESKKINQSLSALGNVISALADQKQPKSHIPYRDSKITRLLEDSLGGNCITTMMAMVSPFIDAFSETLSSIKFANRAKNIKNSPVINEDVNQKALLRKYEAELNKLRSELEEKNKTLIDKKKLYELEEERRQAEMHKVAAVAALEARSKEFMQEREEKKKLEEKIRSMNSQLLVGGRKIEDTPQFRNALEEQQKLIRQQYEKRLQDLEKERTQIEEDKAQVDRYKQLLLKQRDIMIALTTRLNERDETIIQLQEELDAYDRIHRETEEHLEIQKAKTEQLEQILKESNIPLPNDQEGRDSSNKAPLSAKGYNPDIVTYDGEETYNVTKGNLLNAEEKIGELTKVAMSQKQEIEKLKKELEVYKASSSENSDGVIQKLTQMQEQIKKYEDNENNLLKIIQKKNEEIKLLQNVNQGTSNSSNTQSQFITYNNQIEIKKSVDRIIECLSGQNEPEQLQEVAKKLLYLQKLVNTSLLPPTTDQSKIPLAMTQKTKSMNMSMNNKQSEDNVLMPSDPNLTNTNPNPNPGSLKGHQVSSSQSSSIASLQSNTIQKSYSVNLNDSHINNQNDNSIVRHSHHTNNNSESSLTALNPNTNTNLTDNTSTTSGTLRGEITKLIGQRSHSKTNSNENNNYSPISSTPDLANNANTTATTTSTSSANTNSNSNSNTSNIYGNNASGLNVYYQERPKKVPLNLENIINIDPKRPALTVEEMLRLKREEANKNKSADVKI